MDYEINKDTLAVLPVSNDICKVIEKDNEYLFDTIPVKVIEHSCEYFGSTYEGRQKGTKHISGISHKSPIIIEDSNKLIFFPTTSPNNKNCVWISLNNILSYEKGKEKDVSRVIFKSGIILDLNISLNSLTNQIFRASRLQILLDERIKNNKY